MRYSYRADRTMRLGDFLRLSGVSGSLIRRCKRVPRGITVNGEARFTNTYVNEGDTVELTEPDEKTPDTEPRAIAGVSVLYEDSDCIVYNKPFGVPCHRSKGHDTDTLANHHAYYTGGGVFRCINRLDRDTSGCCLVAKSANAAYRLSGSADKRYTAVCTGFPGESGVIEVPIKREEGSIIKRTCSPDGQYAKTSYTVTAQSGGYSLCEVTLETGRTHQIRVHFAFLGHPLAGDDMYGGSREHISRQALHCSYLGFTGIDGVRVSVSSPLPEDIKRLIF